MSSRAYEGRYKAWLFSTAPADWDAAAEGERELTEVELTAATRLLRLVSDGAVAVTFTTNTASQALIDLGKVSHNIGTREVTGVSVTHEIDFPLDTDAMWGQYAYGDKRWLAVCPDCPDPDPANILADTIFHFFEVETGETEPQAAARDTKQNFMVTLAVQDWDLNVAYVPTA